MAENPLNWSVLLDVKVSNKLFEEVFQRGGLFVPQYLPSPILG